MNFQRFIASCLCMVGLTSSIAIYLQSKTQIGFFHIIFFNIIGILLMYKSINGEKNGDSGVA